MHKKVRKLKLNKQTIRVLKDPDLRAAAGGTDSWPPHWTNTRVACLSGTTIGCYCTEICDCC